MRARHSPTRDRARDHRACASMIAGRIGRIQRALGAAAASTWERQVLTNAREVTCGSSAQPS